MIRVSSAEEFKRLVEALAHDVGSANIHWRLYRDLHSAIGEDRIVWHQSPAFWYLTFNAHTFAAVQCLSRVFDQNRRALHLLSWLRTIEVNLHLFERSAFEQRLSGNPFVASLAEHPRVPDASQLAKDIELCSASNREVKLLVRHRNNLGAHLNAESVASGVAPLSIPVDDLEVLLNRAHEIVNRYSSLFAASSYSRQIVGHDDYRFVIKSIKEAVERSRASSAGG